MYLYGGLLLISNKLFYNSFITSERRNAAQGVLYRGTTVLDVVALLQRLVLGQNFLPEEDAGHAWPKTYTKGVLRNSIHTPSKINLARATQKATIIVPFGVRYEI